MIQLFKLMKYEEEPPRTILIILKIFLTNMNSHIISKQPSYI